MRLLLILSVVLTEISAGRYGEDITKCPKVKSLRILDLDELMGQWYVVEYYSMGEEVVSYRCMRAVLRADPGPTLLMNLTYGYVDDPDAEILGGNFTWLLPDLTVPAHWVHKEDSYEGVYNTLVLDAEVTEWCLLLHCLEKNKSPPYLSALVMSRKPTLPNNVKAFLRDKLLRYQVSIQYLFPVKQEGCGSSAGALHYARAPPAPGLAAPKPAKLPSSKPPAKPPTSKRHRANRALRKTPKTTLPPPYNLLN